MHNFCFILFLFLTFTSYTTIAKTNIIYVNNITGSDSFSGKTITPTGNGNGPLATIKKAFKVCEKSTRIEVANTGKPYKSGNYLTRDKGGTAEQPMIINGNGATLSGLDVIPASKWRKVKGNIIATAFWPMANYLKSSSKTRLAYWVGNTRIWWLDNQPGINCKSQHELENTPKGFWWNKKKREVWVNLPEGKDLSNTKIQIPVHSTGIAVFASYVTVKNLRCMFSWNDGFDTAKDGKNIVFKNCLAIDNCGQGFSCHNTSSALYEDCLAERCASSGVCNVDSCATVFRRCIFIDNTYEAGVHATGKTLNFFEDCLIINNQPGEQIWQHGKSKLIFYNCVIIGNNIKGKGILRLRNGSVEFDQCTIVDSTFLVRLSSHTSGTVVIENSLLGRFEKPIIAFPKTIVKKRRIMLKHNIFFEAPGLVGDGKLYSPDKFDEFRQTGVDVGSVWKNIKLGGQLKVDIPSEAKLEKAGLRNNRPAHIGARLPKSVWEMYKRTRMEYPTPQGIQSKELKKL
jgi:hypothetical protein